MMPAPTPPLPDLAPLRPRIELEDVQAERLDAEPPLEALADPAPSRRAPLFLAGAATLALGVGGLSLANFVADQFTRAAWLGWTTLGVAAAGVALLGAGAWQDLRAVLALRHVDGLRADLASNEPRRIMSAAVTNDSRPGSSTTTSTSSVVIIPTTCLVAGSTTGKTCWEPASRTTRTHSIRVSRRARWRARARVKRIVFRARSIRRTRATSRRTMSSASPRSQRRAGSFTPTRASAMHRSSSTPDSSTLPKRVSSAIAPATSLPIRFSREHGA